MHHPGPPRFVAVGGEIDLAPRDPDPSASYRWRVVERPTDSRATLGDDPVEAFAPDAAGTYRVALDASDGTHHLTVRAFPADLAVGGGEGTSGYSGYSGRSGGGRRGRSGGASGSGSGVGGGGPEGGRPRVHLTGEREGDVVRLRAHARRAGEDADDPSLDVEFIVDDRDREAAAGLDVEGHEAVLPLPDAPVRVHAVAVGGTYSVPDAVRVHPDGRVERLHDPPAWATEATIYEIYVRGFADAPEGEVFDALVDRLDYLGDLGVDTLWLTPVLQNDDFDHGYNTTDFFDVASDLGSRAEFESFVDAAHDRGMRVLFDLVLNHSAREHPHFQDAYGNPDSPYYDWYEWQDSGEPETYFEWPYIANFDYTNLEVRRHLLDAVDEWAPVVDGFRCDMAWAVPQSFWMEIRERVKERDREFLLLDETVPYVADFHGRLFDVHFDTTLYFTLREVGRDNAPASAVLDAIEQRQRVGFPDHAGFMTYIENHDEHRYVEECGRDATLPAAAATFLLPGVPMLYSGQEFGARGRRGRVDWEARDEGLEAGYRDLLRTRAETPALGYDGDLVTVDWQVEAGTDADDVVAFAREGGGEDGDEGERYVVVLNFGGEPARVRLDEAVDPVDRVSGADASADGSRSVVVEDVAVLPARGSDP